MGMNDPINECDYGARLGLAVRDLFGASLGLTSSDMDTLVDVVDTDGADEATTSPRDITVSLFYFPAGSDVDISNHPQAAATFDANLVINFCDSQCVRS